MFLKELDIYGFKSFGKKTKLSFNSGVTAIVGPNGCGKSNITDAVRWVLGEQNIRSLRGKQLTDIIFSGNHKTKPLNIAEVSLTINNSEKILLVDWEEVNIKRRIYRSGETENFINGISCRLKDIQELFMNTGLSKNTYSIVAQGEVDLILSAKPSERRYLFEEAASISKYRYEKKKTLNKIVETNNNLDKIENIISEIKNQLLILEGEANHLNSYKICRKEIKNLELFLLYQRYNLCRTNLSKIKKNLEYYEKEKNKIIQKIKEDEVAINLLSIELNNLSKEQEKYKYDNYELDNRKKIIQNELNLMLQKKGDIEKRLVDLNKEAESINQKIVIGEQNKKAVSLNTLEINQKLDSYNKKLISLNKEIDNISNFTNSLNIIEINSRELLKIISKKELFLRESKIRYSTTLNIIDVNLEKIRGKRALLENQLKNMLAKELDYQKIVRENRKKGNGAQLKLNEEKVKEIEIILKKIQAEVEKDKNVINLKEERKNILKKSIKTNGGKNGQKTDIFYFKYCQKYPDNLCEKIIKLIDNIPSKYDKIMKIALKESLNSIVVSDISYALNIINSIPKNELVKLKIVPMNLLKNVKTFPGNQANIKNKNICGFACELINYSQKYQNLFKLLLGNVLIVEDTKTALDISNEYLGKYKIISLNGMVINIDGSVDFYSESTNSENYKESFYYVEKEIEKLEKEIKTLKIKIEKNDSIIEKNNDIYNSLWKENQDIKRLLQESEKNLTDSVSNLNKSIVSINELKDSLKSILIEENSILEERKIISEKLRFLKKNYNTLSEYNKNISNSYNTINQIIRRGKNRINNIYRDINDLKNIILINKEKLINIKEKAENVSQYKDEYSIDLNKKRSAIKEYNEKLDDIFKKIKEHRIQIERLDKENPAIFMKSKKIGEILQEKSNLLKNIQQDKMNQQKTYEAIKDKQHREEMLEVQHREKYVNTKEEVNKNYNLALEKLELYKNKAGSQKEASERIDVLRDDILRMGQINFEAENRYNNQLQRYNSLYEKYEDICKAKKYLEITISEIDQIATERLKKTFNQVKIYFNDIFKKIFPGGEGSLVIESEKDILNSGVEIIARPPGKKTQNIELLSSGEKALTAIALLMALRKVNPSPFCFFDEIDTSLDEVNAERLTHILKGEDLKQSQLVIITHQKAMMEAADTLYGITMEESGISKLVSVKFEK